MFSPSERAESCGLHTLLDGYSLALVLKHAANPGPVLRNPPGARLLKLGL